MTLDRALVVVAALAAQCWLALVPAAAENRIALVIGNSSYETVSVLPNPANDARAMTELLTLAGFEVVSAPNLTQGGMRQTIGNFATTVAGKGPDTVALVFYAGHGLQVDGENFLVPVDARIQREADVAVQAMRLTDVMNMLAAVPSKTRIVIRCLEVSRGPAPRPAGGAAPSGPPISIGVGVGIPIGRGGGHPSGPIRSGPQPGGHRF
jgi:Caspase domain